MDGLTHFNEDGMGHMVDVVHKNETLRVAKAKGKIHASQRTIDRILEKDVDKGDVLSVSQIAGIMGAKQTSTLIPMCHNLNLHGVDLSFEVDEGNRDVLISAEVKTVGKTGVEMEALTAVSIAALTIYDMCKAIDKEMVIGDIKLMEKVGGKSGLFRRTQD